MGPGILVKSLLQGSFSLMVFGWCQIVMDIQPLVAIVSGVGKLHGFTHTYVGATLIAIVAAITGKYLTQWALVTVLRVVPAIRIRWWVAFLSAFIGSFRQHHACGPSAAATVRRHQRSARVHFRFGPSQVLRVQRTRGGRHLLSSQ
jgi:hypothetical protein